jgi:hypothetical protein
MAMKLVGLVLLVMSGFAQAEPGPPPATRAGAGVASAAIPSTALPTPASLAGLVRIFPRGEVWQVAGRASFGAQLDDVLKTIARDSAGREVEVAFVVDRSLESNLGAELELALAANRDKLPRGRLALIACGVRDGSWSARVLAPLAPDAYATLRATEHVDWQPEGSGMGARVAGLAAAARLDWRAKQGHPHIVLVADEPAQGLAFVGPADGPAGQLADVAHWAQSSQASLHVLRCALDEHDGRGRDASSDSLERRHLVTVDQVAGLFRQGRHVKVASPDEFASALASALEPLTSDTSAADVALLVDAKGKVGEATRALRDRQAAFDGFMSHPHHRVALVQFFDKGPPKQVLGLTGDKGALARALRGLPRVGPGDYPKNVSAAVLSATRLGWNPAARKALVMVTAAAARGGVDPSLLDWAESNRVAVTIIEPPRVLTAAGRQEP